MTFESALPDEARQRIGEIDRADILVGILSFNNAATIGHVVQRLPRGWSSISRT